MAAIKALLYSAIHESRDLVRLHIIETAVEFFIFFNEAGVKKKLHRNTLSSLTVHSLLLPEKRLKKDPPTHPPAAPAG